MTVPTAGERNLIMQCGQNPKALIRRATEAERESCLAAGWIERGYGWYATTALGAAAAGIEFDRAEYELRMGPLIKSGQLELFVLPVPSGGRCHSPSRATP